MPDPPRVPLGSRYGAEPLVRGASRLAAALRNSLLVIGLTVVAFGTGALELAVSVRSALAGQADIALGNAVGSNIYNVLVIHPLEAPGNLRIAGRFLCWLRHVSPASVPLRSACGGCSLTSLRSVGLPFALG